MSKRLAKACVRVSVVLHLKPFLSQVNWLLRILAPTVILRALTTFDEGFETGGFSHILGVVGIL